MRFCKQLLIVHETSSTETHNNSLITFRGSQKRAETFSVSHFTHLMLHMAAIFAKILRIPAVNLNNTAIWCFALTFSRCFNIWTFVLVTKQTLPKNVRLKVHKWIIWRLGANSHFLLCIVKKLEYIFFYQPVFRQKKVIKRITIKNNLKYHSTVAWWRTLSNKVEQRKPHREVNCNLPFCEIAPRPPVWPGVAILALEGIPFRNKIDILQIPREIYFCIISRDCHSKK